MYGFAPGFLPPASWYGAPVPMYNALPAPVDPYAISRRFSDPLYASTSTPAFSSPFFHQSTQSQQSQLPRSSSLTGQGGFEQTVQHHNALGNTTMSSTTQPVQQRLSTRPTRRFSVEEPNATPGGKIPQAEFVRNQRRQQWFGKQ
eukprot:TRINITY_DN67155_c3_g1_i1.p1 TRINITY_DN67155_c3_g1~~TRINITY_DN67155_c3_g1_i1.p1  ORF type:complete len:145 (+),score=9.86 TRINITY_DN67155_c3_g1_i1:27-461(+)